MRTILRRKDKTSIYIPPSRRHQASFTAKTKVIQTTIGCSLLVVGLLIMTTTI